MAAFAPFFVRVKSTGDEAYAEVDVPGGSATSVSRLAALACAASPHWAVGASAVALSLVDAVGDDLPTPAAEAAAVRIFQVGWTLERAGVRSGAWLVARLAQSAAAAAPSLATLVEAVNRSAAANQRAELERLLIRPTFSLASTPSRGSGGGRSPKAQERFQLKLDVITFYGLWDPATATEPEVAQRRVFTMLPPAGGSASVTLSDAVLAHIWPSALAGESDALRRLLGLPAAFHLQPRNFLILDKAVARAFDADALLLLPVREAPPVPPRVRARPFRVAEFQTAAAGGCSGGDGDGSGGCVRSNIAALADRELYLPRAAEGCTPFMRLLAWKALSALRAGAEADEAAAAEFPGEVGVDATLARDDAGRPRGATGFTALLSTGLVFGLGAHA